MHYRVREKVVCSNNMIAEIIVYRNHKDIDVRYEENILEKIKFLQRKGLVNLNDKKYGF